MSTVLVNATNRSDTDVFVSGQPDWDDQQLMVNGETIQGAYKLPDGETVAVSVNWDAPPAEEMMGVVFSPDRSANTGFFLAVGEDPATGNLAVTSNNSFGELTFRFTVADQEPWSLAMTFENA